MHKTNGTNGNKAAGCILYQTRVLLQKNKTRKGLIFLVEVYPRHALRACQAPKGCVSTRKAATISKTRKGLIFLVEVYPRHALRACQAPKGCVSTRKAATISNYRKALFIWWRFTHGHILKIALQNSLLSVKRISGMSTFRKRQPTALIEYDEQLVRHLIEKVSILKKNLLWNLNPACCWMCLYIPI